MLSLSEKASGYLQQLEDDRLAAIAASEEKAWEAKLIGARLEGFRQAMELALRIPSGHRLGPQLGPRWNGWPGRRDGASVMDKAV